jgi:hypothetical protein
MRSATLLAAVLALAADVAAAEPGEARSPPAGDAGSRPHRVDGLDVAGRFRVTEDGVVLELAGARVELRRLRGPTVPPPSGAHDIRATFSLDGRATSFLLRVMPPPEGGGDSPHR